MNLTMRDILIEGIYHRMKRDGNIFFLTADFGSPKLDLIRNDHITKNNYLNVGIAEANLINIATGLALEGFTVYSYAISAFISMRSYEQIRNNLALLSQLKKNLNVNMIGVGIGMSYDMSGPSHHCLEDLSIMRTLPNIEIFSPSDNRLVEKFIDYSIRNKRPKYIRLDGKPLLQIYENTDNIILENGFNELKKGKDICLITTGYMTHTAIKITDILKDYKIGIIDIFLLRPLDEELFYKTVREYRHLITIEEGFINKGGLDSLVSYILDKKNSDIKLTRIGFGDKYVFDIGDRNYLHRLNQIDEESIIKIIKLEVK